MRSQDPAGRAVSLGDNDGALPHAGGTSHQRPASIVSSRMTDIASDDGGEATAGNANPSRPETARTGASSKATWAAAAARKALAPGLQSNRASLASTSASAPARTPSLTTRSHVPSLTSGAFLRPMSSQKLQAQRGAGARPVPVNQQLRPPPANLDDNETDMGGSLIDGASGGGNMHNIAQLQRKASAGQSLRPPPSRGTEVTDEDMLDRFIANASPTTAHFPAASMSDSVRPLQARAGQSRDLTINVDKSYRDLANHASPVRSTKSFRSSFLLPAKAEQAHPSRHRDRDTAGAEKLSSTASSPRLPRVGSRSGPQPSATRPQGQSRGRVHQYFDGNTVFCLGGRWQNTRHTPINIATGALIVIPCALFYGFEAPWLWHNVSPAIPVTFAYLTYLCLSSFVHASVSDPGILPRNLHQFPPVSDQDDPLRLGPPTNDWTLVKSAESSAAAMEVPVKHCRTCNIWRPPRAHHCRLCDNCVETHDHHCVWLNNCVGKRNYRYFFAFVTSSTILAAYLIGTSLTLILTHMNRANISFGESIDHFRVAFALVILGVALIVYPGGLTGYHLFLMARGETTREYINSHKFAKKERYRAYSQGNWLKNLMVVLCRPRSPAYYRFKGKYRPGDQRLGQHYSLRTRKNPQGLELDVVAPGSRGFQGPVALRGESRG
ncbi:Palmitoyltransferase ERF2 [Metarhizium album ARSEF 1941]|uniref:Palmitoyltransferase n=1 Tax=Metarhizium album (strain ARSEF 1941) TaxID=1081103 RepID=A0A0B2X1P4_METAS|nr:Palmitoyltransferase ERF2 [Metarhizium album ARSEF 1941]KHO00229.1 Palmitoyltransferase ERF2 [Metarhizium album ARSEF 1941]